VVDARHANRVTAAARSVGGHKQEGVRSMDGYQLGRDIQSILQRLDNLEQLIGRGEAANPARDTPLDALIARLLSARRKAARAATASGSDSDSGERTAYLLAYDMPQDHEGAIFNPLPGGKYEVRPRTIDWYNGHGSDPGIRFRSARGNGLAGNGNFVWDQLLQYSVVFLDLKTIPVGPTSVTWRQVYQVSDNPIEIVIESGANLVVMVNDTSGDFDDNHGQVELLLIPK
jgi:hypothetical protein